MGDDRSNRGQRWSAIPTWIQTIVGVVGLLATLGVIGVATSSSPSSPRSHTRRGPSHQRRPPPRPRTPPKPLALDTATATDSTDPADGSRGSGLATIAGASFPHSVRQVYTANCCSDSQSVTYAIPDGYKRFQAWVGLETGGTYKQDDSPTVTFEADLGSASNVVYKRTARYGDAAARVKLDLAGQRALTLKTTTDDSNCGVCDADAVWGSAQLLP